MGFNELLRELHVLSKELNELFAQLLGSLTNYDRRRAYQIFSIRLAMIEDAARFLMTPGLAVSHFFVGVIPRRVQRGPSICHA